MSRRVLLTLGGGHLAIGIARALKATEDPPYIISTDSSKYHLYQSEGDELHLIPRANHPRYLETLCSVAEDTGADFVWPMHDAEIARLAEAEGNLPFRTWVPPISVVRACRDKMATYMKLREADVPAPESQAIDTKQDLISALNTHGEIWLRSRSGAGAQGALKTSNLDHAVAWLEINAGWGSFMAARVLDCPVDYSWEAIWKDGKLVASQAITRLVRGSTGISIPGVRSRTVAQNDAPAEVHSVSERAVKAVMESPDGLFRVDLLADTDGTIKVTEVDAGRFGSGGVAFWHKWGLNFPDIVLKLAFNEPIDYEIPIVNPTPKDVVIIQGINRDAAFAKIDEVESAADELSKRLSGLG